MRRLARIETSRTILSGFTRCLHYLAATVEHVRRSAWSVVPFPVTLENTLVRWTLARFSVRWPVMLRRSPAGNVASTKFPPPRPSTVPHHPRRRPSSWRLARSARFYPRPHRSFSFRSIYPPFALGPPRSLLLQPFALLCRLLSLSLSLMARFPSPRRQATSFLLIYQSFRSSRRFHRNAMARERRRMERNGDSHGCKGEGHDSANMTERDGDSSESTKFVLAEERTEREGGGGGGGGRERERGGEKASNLNSIARTIRSR